jgi:hypothetical protein
LLELPFAPRSLRLNRLPSTAEPEQALCGRYALGISINRRRNDND